MILNFLKKFIKRDGKGYEKIFGLDEIIKLAIIYNENEKLFDGIQTILNYSDKLDELKELKGKNLHDIMKACSLKKHNRDNKTNPQVDFNKIVEGIRESQI